MDETTRTAAIDTGDLYESIRREFAITLTTHSDRLQTVVPACPAWTVHDVVAHVVGLASDLNAQRFPVPGEPADAWTDAQVRRARDRSLRDLLQEWALEGPRFAEGLRLFGYEFGSHFVADLFVHVQDVRHALGLPAERHVPAVMVGLDHYLGFLDGLLTAEQWGTLTVTTPEERRVIGAGPRAAAVRTTSFELLRTLSARRSLAQVRSLDWDGDVSGLLGFLGTAMTGSYAFRATDLVE